MDREGDGAVTSARKIAPCDRAIEVNKTGTLTAIVKPYDWLKPVCPKWIFTPPGNGKGSVLEAIETGKICSM